MNKTVITSLVISLVINVALLYRVFDLGSIMTYTGEDMYQEKQQTLELEKLLPLLRKNLSREQVEQAARAVDLEVIESGENGILVGRTHFSFTANQVTSITLD